MQFLRQSSTPTIHTPPVLDSTTLAAVTNATIQKADVRLTKEGGTLAAAHANQGTADAGAAHDALGKYKITLDATDTGTPGRLTMTVAKSGTVAVEREFMVLSAAAYDAYCAGADLGTAAAVAAVLAAIVALNNPSLTDIKGKLNEVVNAQPKRRHS